MRAPVTTRRPAARGPVPRGLGRAATLLGLALIPVPHAATALGVLQTTPPAHTLDAAPDTPITVRFDRPVDRSSFQHLRSFWAFARWSGTVDGTFTFSHGDSVVSLVPSFPRSAGERVLVVLSRDLRAADGSTLRASGYSFQFWTRSQPGGLRFREAQRLSTRDDPLVSTRAYGGVAVDLDGDRDLDLTVVNEDTADLRMFLNLGNGRGLFSASMLPPASVAPRASPSESADFDRDGSVDLCVANINANSVSILLGRGDGTFLPQQLVVVGNAPRGITVLDVDGDGDLDIVNTNFGSNNLSVLVNDGTGVFGGPQFHEGGGEGEWAVDTADFDDDGVLDLALGAQTSQTVLIARGRGDGTFTPGTPRSCGGGVWMLNAGDIDADGTEDIVTVNGRSNNAAVLRGGGDGTLGRATLFLPDPFPLATDLGDLDGDGDLDWVTSSFSGDWLLYRNDGGSFTNLQRFTAPRAASCALLFDANGDGDLDLALIDEIADEVLVMHQDPPTAVRDLPLGALKRRYRGR